MSALAKRKSGGLPQDVGPFQFPNGFFSFLPKGTKTALRQAQTTALIFFNDCLRVASTRFEPPGLQWAGWKLDENLRELFREGLALSSAWICGTPERTSKQMPYLMPKALVAPFRGPEFRGEESELVGSQCATAPDGSTISIAGAGDYWLVLIEGRLIEYAGYPTATVEMHLSIALANRLAPGQALPAGFSVPGRAPAYSEHARIVSEDVQSWLTFEKAGKVERE